MTNFVMHPPPPGPVGPPPANRLEELQAEAMGVPPVGGSFCPGSLGASVYNPGTLGYTTPLNPPLRPQKPGAVHRCVEGIDPSWQKAVYKQLGKGLGV